MDLHPGDRRLLSDLELIDDRGLELAEAIVHEQRHRHEINGFSDPGVDRALRALSGVRELSRRRI